MDTHPPGAPRLLRAPFHQVLIVIPTVANPRVLVPAFDRLCRNLDGLLVHIVASVNPLDAQHAAESITALKQIWESYAPRLPGCHLSIYNHGGPAGFGGAINLGLKVALGALTPGFSTCPITELGIAPLTVFFNDDLHVTRGWLRGQVEALTSEQVEEWAELARQDEQTGVWFRPKRAMADYGRVGLIGPVTNLAAGIQQVGEDYAEAFQKMGVDAFAELWRKQRSGSVLTATFLSGFCMGITYECFTDLAVFGEDGAFTYLFDERYLIAGYEDNDLCVRADRKGWRAIVAADCFIGHIGHQTFDAAFPEMDRGMRNRLTYYDVWRPELVRDGRKVVAIYRVRFDVPHDLALMRMSLASTGRLVDGIAILLTRNPGEVLQHEETRQAMAAGQLPEPDMHLLTGCARAPDRAAAYLRDWSQRWANQMDGSRKPKVVVESWTGGFNERTERNHLIGMAEQMGADWVFSIDHDEVVEPRVGRAYLDRLMHHPDPLVQQFDIAFVNHWIDNRSVRIDRPWGHGGTWTGGMRGFRFFRVNKAAPRRILAGGHNGLHCGNVPGADAIAKRVAGLRIRHFGYMRWLDRVRKERRYNVQDPNPDPMLVGATSYSHITHEEGMVISSFAPENGIGLHMLVYEREKADNVARHLDALYTLCDRIVLVWTGAWADEDKGWLLPEQKIGAAPTRRASPTVFEASREDWPTTGPGWELARFAEHFGVEWVHHPLADSLSDARNAGIRALHGTPGMGWALFLDPDEHLPQLAPVNLRQMAEAIDAWGWLFRFVNRHADGGGNQSESVRMSRLDPEGRMMMNGRVHESFQRAVDGLLAEGYGSILRVAPFVTMNVGLALSSEEMDAKLERYRRLAELDLRDDPYQSGPWTSLGLYWLNEGCDAAAMECFGRAMACAGSGYLAFREAGVEYMRKALACLREAEARMGNHSMRRPTSVTVEFLEKAAPPLPRMGLVASGGRAPVSEAEAFASLPPFDASAIPAHLAIPNGTVSDGVVGLVE